MKKIVYNSWIARHTLQPGYQHLGKIPPNIIKYQQVNGLFTKF